MQISFGNNLNIKQSIQRWVLENFEDSIVLHSNGHSENLEMLVAVGVYQKFISEINNNFFEDLKDFHERYKCWLFGYLTYDLKNETETFLDSKNLDGLGFPDYFLFEPLYVLKLTTDGQLVALNDRAISDLQTIYQAIVNHSNATEQAKAESHKERISLKSRITKTEYLDTISKIRSNILEGDFYEVNFCQEFYAENVNIDPFKVFEKLNELSSSPFAAFAKLGDINIMCASPERFLRKEGQMLMSQPIKGTRKRSTDPIEDNALALELASNPKDKAENVMIVDLVRNDLAKCSLPGSVKVTELFGIHKFNTVWQMISTVEAQLKPELSWVDALKATFPMGSMTGAPKVMAMQKMEDYESSKRGVYSGSIGYVTPAGDFDFNVVIRTILYNSSNKYLSFHAGGAIVYDSVPEQEFEECLTKTLALRKALGLA